MTDAGGQVATGFERVAEEFARNFSERGEVGAAFAVYRDAALIVDLHGGLADSTGDKPWRSDTVVPIFSGTKALVAACLLRLLDAGEIDLDEPVATYWPQFAARGKSHVLVRHVVSHTAGLPGIRQRTVSPDEVLDDRRMAWLLEDEVPVWEPGSTISYHPLTFGWLCGELVRRITGHSVGQFFATEVAAPLGLDIWIGLPPEHAPRVARLEFQGSWGKSDHTNPACIAADPLREAIWGNPPLLVPGVLDWNTPRVRAAEVPGGSAIAHVPAMARFFGCLACDGALAGTRLLSRAAIAAGCTTLARGHDPLDGKLMHNGVGFSLQTPDQPLGPPPSAFGHGGAGGSLHGAWPAYRVGFSYAMNQLRDDEVDERSSALLTALFVSLERGA